MAAPAASQGPTKAVPTSTEEPSKPVAAPSQEPSKAAATKRKELAATTALHRGESNTASSFMTALGEFKLPTSVTRIVRQGALHALTVLTIKAAPNHKATSEHPSIKKAKLLADKTDKPTYAPTATIVSSPTPSPTYSPTATSYPTRAVTTQRSPEDPYFMSCGVRGNMDEYYKFHRTGDDMGCERSCSMLTSNKKPSLKLYQKPVNYETDTVLAFITELDEKNTLHSIRRLSERNFVCLGNATSPSAPQSFRMMLGGGTNLADPRWNFCNVAPTSVASIVEFTVHDWTNCTSKVVANFACSEATELPMLFFLYGDKGVGWNGGLYLIMSYPTTASSIIKSLLQPEKDDGFKIVNVGTLAGNKQTGIKDMCISDGCYSTTIAPGNTPDDIFMIMCGGVATPGADVAFEVSMP